MFRVSSVSITVDIELGSRKKIEKFYVYAVHRKKNVGTMLVIIETCGRAYVGDVRLSSEFHNKNIGKRMYEAAIEHLGHLSTRFDEASVSAQRIWLSLIHSQKYEYNLQSGSYLCLWPKGKRLKKSIASMFTKRK
jgi:GNAT superfamily N-acetyltransferase